MTRILGFVLGAILATTRLGPPVAGTPDPGTPDRIRATDAVSGQIGRLIEPQVRADLFSGVILVQRGDRAVFQRAYGFASWELRVANSNQTRFGIASITKPMTEALVSLLVKEHRLDPRAPVEQYIPGFPRGAGGGKPTIDQLLKHKAGVPHRVTTAAEEMLPLHPADIVERVKARGLLFEPGSGVRPEILISIQLRPRSEGPMERGERRERRCKAAAGIERCSSETRRDRAVC